MQKRFVKILANQCASVFSALARTHTVQTATLFHLILHHFGAAIAFKSCNNWYGHVSLVFNQSRNDKNVPFMRARGYVSENISQFLRMGVET